MGRSEMRWSEMQESDGVALGLLDGGGGRGRRGPRLIWVSRSHSCQGRAAAGGNSWLQPALLPTLLMEPTDHPSPASPAPSRDNAHRSIPPPRNWWMLADIIWQLCQLSPRHLQHQQETGAKKRNRWENVAAVQEPRKLYFRQLRRSSKNRNTHLRIENALPKNPLSMYLAAFRWKPERRLLGWIYLSNSIYCAEPILPDSGLIFLEPFRSSLIPLDDAKCSNNCEIFGIKAF